MKGIHVSRKAAVRRRKSEGRLQREIHLAPAACAPAPAPANRIVDGLTSEQKELLLQVCTWRRESFPNGSNYREQALPKVVPGVVTLTWHGVWVYARFDSEPGITRVFHGGRRSVGPGVDLGVHFCTRDQVIDALIDI